MIWQLGERTLDFRHRLQIMGILNTTPDSFFDGGAYLDPAGSRKLELLRVT